MHIPDGYLSPQTFVPLYAVMIPLWMAAARRVRRTLRTRQVPLLALGAAFSFIIMMFNIPVPGGTTGHAVGAALVAILLGPWAACVAVSLTLVIQAFLFGDGGITTLAANAFTMAVVMPFVGCFSYRLIAGDSPATSPRRVVAAFGAGYLALNGAALYTAVMFGLQPLIASAPDGRPLYAPYPLAVAVPALALPHLLLFGVVEGVATALIIRYLQGADPALLSLQGAGEMAGGTLQRLRSGLGVLALLSPLGVIVPWLAGAGTTWGEWGAAELGGLTGFVPEGVERLGRVWRAPLGDFLLADPDRGGVVLASLASLLAAALGIALLVICARVCGRLSAFREDK
ncbi:MAG: cobalt transporter CbiM [Geobacteraceae bacterium]|nr:cobalt transporter CbiM [Geobacteraceae bacterium]